VGWDRALASLFDDLEQQAEGMALSARDADVAEHGRAEYVSVDLESRVHASVGALVTCDLLGGHRLRGTLGRAGRDWLLLVPAEGSPDGDDSGWVVHLPCVTRMSGLGPRALAPEARGVLARLGLGSVLRRLAESRSPVLLALTDGAQVRGGVGRIGADFVEVLVERSEPGTRAAVGPDVMPLAAVAALRGL
jgi:hypothetical protein